SGRDQAVPRPTKKAEFTIVHATREAQVGWRDVLATQRNAVADAWDFITRHPDQARPTNYRLRGGLATVTHAGTAHARWQHKLAGGARIWFYVDGQTVHLIDVHTRHPNETK
ncbi:MAG: hypothetical protein ACRCYX_11890, partial [Dermatophilaceae bacterium]